MTIKQKNSSDADQLIAIYGPIGFSDSCPHSDGERRKSPNSHQHWGGSQGGWASRPSAPARPLERAPNCRQWVGISPTFAPPERFHKPEAEPELPTSSLGNTQHPPRCLKPFHCQSCFAMQLKDARMAQTIVTGPSRQRWDGP